VSCSGKEFEYIKELWGASDASKRPVTQNRSIGIQRHAINLQVTARASESVDWSRKPKQLDGLSMAIAFLLVYDSDLSLLSCERES